MPRRGAAAIEFEEEGLDELIEFIDMLGDEGIEAAKRGHKNWAEYTFEVSIDACPKDKGGLVDSGDMKVEDGGLTVIIQYTAPYAAAVHDGYVQHFIAPKHREALRWESETGGRYAGRVDRLNRRGRRKDVKWAFSKGHQVPARKLRSKPNPWLSNSVDATEHLQGDFIFEELDPLIERGI
jgi:hypothetical protein